MSDLQITIKQVLQKVEKHRDLYSRSEQSVRDHLINPILRTIGWDTTEPDLVQPNVTNDDGRIPDYTLLKEGKKVLVLEAKKLSKNLDDSKIIRQLADYCYPHGIEFGILTDGVIWQLFNTFEKNPNNRIVWTIDLSLCQEMELAKLESLGYENIDNLEYQLIQTKILNDYFDSVFQTKDSFIEWCKTSLKEKFIKDYRQYKYQEESINQFISQKLSILLSEIDLPLVAVSNTTHKTNVEEFPKLKVENNQIQYRNYELNAPFTLNFTKVVEGQIENEFAKSWNPLLNILIKQLILTGKPIADIKNIAGVNIQSGNLNDNGFVPIESTNYSLQNVDGHKAGKGILSLAKKYNKRVDIKFIWRDKPNAAFPNEYGRIMN